MRAQSNERGSDVVYLPMVTAGEGPGRDLMPYDSSYSGMDDYDDDGFDLKALINVVRRYRWMVFSIFAVFVSLALIGTMLMRPLYRAQAMLEIKPNTSSIKFQNIERPWESSKEFFETQSRILQSESVAKAVINSLDLEKNPELTGEMTQRGVSAGVSQLIETIKTRLSSSPQVDPVASDTTSGKEFQLERNVLTNYTDRLKVNLVRNSQLFLVSFESFDPNLAANVANQVTAEYINNNDARRFNANSGAKVFLEGEIEKVRAKLESSERDLTEFARKNRIVDIEDKSNIMATRMQELSTALSEVQTARIAAEALYEQTNDSGAENSVQVLESTLIARLKSQLAELDAEYERNLKIYKPSFPKMKQLSAQRDDVKRSLDGEILKINESFKVQYEQLVSREQLITDALESQKQNLLDLKDRAIQYNILKREWETNKELYSGLLERIKEMGIAGGMELNNVSVIDSAAVPISPFKPNLAKNLLVAALTGMLVGLVLALLLSYFDNTINDPTELERLTKTPNLGLVPLVGEKDIPVDTNLDLVSHSIREHEVSEAYRSIRTSLMYSSVDETMRTLAVTSTTAGEGKSTTAINLAIVMAQNGMRVLLVDCDLRKPRIHKSFDTTSSPGLSEIIIGTAEFSPLSTNVENLSFLPSGKPPPNPAEIISTKKMDEFIKYTQEEYDFVIFDTPPILGLADSVVLSTKVDAIALVVSSSLVSKDAVKEGVKRLRAVRANIAGIVMNRVSVGDGSYGYYNRYYYRYGSKDELSVS